MGAGQAANWAAFEAASGTTTNDGYSVSDAVKDMKKLATSQNGAIPPDGQLTELATNLMKGVNAYFSGSNLLGDYSKIGGSQVMKNLIAMSYSESRFGHADTTFAGTGGRDGGGILQVAKVRLQEYNRLNNSNVDQDSLSHNPALGAQVALWAMAHPVGLQDQKGGFLQAGNVAQPQSSDLLGRMAYFWNYNATSNHGHANELETYMQQRRQFTGILGTS